MFDTQKIMKTHAEMSAGDNPEGVSRGPSAFTAQGNMVLHMVQEQIQTKGRANLERLIEANDKARSKLSK